MRVEELVKEGKIIGFQDDFNINDSINANYDTILFNSGLFLVSIN